MKHFFIVLFLLATLISCKEDDNGGQGMDQNVFGTYQLTSLIPSIPIDADADGTFSLADIATLISCNFRLVLVNDNTYTFNMYRLPQSIGQDTNCCDPNGNLISIDPVRCFLESFSGTLIVSEPSLILKAELGSNLPDKILSINNNVLSYTDTAYFYSNLNGVISQRQVSFQVSFTKI